MLYPAVKERVIGHAKKRVKTPCGGVGAKSAGKGIHMDNFRFEEMGYLSVDLPEDILKRKWHGDFQGADRLISLWLEKDIPAGLRKKLILEREIIKRLPVEYPYRYGEAFARLREKAPDLTEEEFRRLQDQGRIDWIYVDGEERFFNRFVETLLKVTPSLSEPVERESLDEKNREKQALLDVIRQIKEHGSAECRFHIRASLRIKEESFRKGRVKVHIPVPAACGQLEDIRILTAYPEQYELAPSDSPQRAVCFREDMRENHEFWVEYSYLNGVDYVEMKPSEVRPLDPADYAEDLAEQLPHIRFTPYMRALAQELTEGLGNPLDRAKCIYDYITAHVEYSFVRSYFTIENLAEYAAVGGRGDCGIQALMFITLCRIAGVPARWQSGLYTTPFSAGCHDWAQVYIAPYGWRYVDCSFGGSAYREGDEERRRFYFGNLDPFRMVANSRFQQEFDVKKDFLRADPYDNQRGEAEYEDGGLGFGDMTWKAEILEYTS